MADIAGTLGGCFELMKQCFKASMLLKVVNLGIKVLKKKKKKSPSKYDSISLVENRVNTQKSASLD